MLGNQWEARLKKRADGKISLKFWGQFHAPFKRIAYVVTLISIIVLISAVVFNMAR